MGFPGEDADPGGASGEVLDHGSDQPRWSERFDGASSRRWQRWTLGGVTTGVAIAVIAVALHPGRSVSAPRVGSAPVVTTATISLAWARDLSSPGSTLTSYVRLNAGSEGTCPTIASGVRPETGIAAAVAAAIPGAAVTGSARTLDQSAGLCSVQLRVREPGHVQVAVAVAAPDAGAPTVAATKTAGTATVRGITTQFVSTQSATGWAVFVGAVSPAGHQPSSAALQRIADDPRMAW